jgi:hypothetical protein
MIVLCGNYIMIGMIVGILIILALVWLCCRKRIRRGLEGLEGLQGPRRRIIE